jgi:hypothetical protein
MPPAAKSTIRARCRRRCSVLVERAKPSSSARSSVVSRILWLQGCRSCILESGLIHQ